MSLELEKLKRKVEEEIKNSPNAELLNSVRIRYLGRKGELTKILRSLKDLSLEERRRIGAEANLLKKELEDLVTRKIKTLQVTRYKPQKRFDVTKPGKRISRGSLHPLTKIEEEVRRIFTSMNFSVVEGPEIETEYHNFDSLNIPKDHPARDMWNTLWLKNFKLLLRTHTSPVQIRYMLSHNPPFQIIVPGRVFRYEATDASHEINFYQVEGLMVGPNVTLANFKFVVEEFFKRFFGRQIEFRYKPSYFPFVEPGLEVEIRLGGKWLEIMGAGMVHPRVFDAVRYNPDQIQGFAFGMGLDRLAMIKYNIPDIRLFYSGDLRFIKQF